ncbi:hypothetical protein MtrunA17_Chr1g0163711 [Medicago truncatula]|uniref:Transmembrane protein n=1 Tax=Medicago truncatula TaxID=3880 RepID=A0A396JJ78_MEDTR|nr:hypothetical protein MtrunA17_Chr1g0163711 [Medicago truncatula]
MLFYTFLVFYASKKYFPIILIFPLSIRIYVLIFAFISFTLFFNFCSLKFHICS